jgi:hypothetical protein
METMMTKHIIDSPRRRAGQSNGKIVRRYAKLDALMRAEPRKQAEVLRRRPKKLDEGTRLRRYLWIERHAE